MNLETAAHAPDLINHCGFIASSASHPNIPWTLLFIFIFGFMHICKPDSLDQAPGTPPSSIFNSKMLLAECQADPTLSLPHQQPPSPFLFFILHLPTPFYMGFSLWDNHQRQQWDENKKMKKGTSTNMWDQVSEQKAWDYQYFDDNDNDNKKMEYGKKWLNKKLSAFAVTRTEKCVEINGWITGMELSSTVPSAPMYLLLVKLTTLMGTQHYRD